MRCVADPHKANGGGGVGQQQLGGMGMGGMGPGGFPGISSPQAVPLLPPEQMMLAMQVCQFVSYDFSHNFSFVAGGTIQERRTVSSIFHISVSSGIVLVVMLSLQGLNAC